MAEGPMVRTPKGFWDARYHVSEELDVVRLGRDWRVIEATSEWDGVLGPPWPDRAAARDAALERVERGDYR